MVKKVKIIQGGIGHASLDRLIAAHHRHCAADTEAGKCNRLDADQYQTPDLTLWSAWQGDQAVGMIALKALGNGQGEVKSMHVRADARGQGIADQLLDTLVDYAHASGVITLLLETGDTPAFAAARRFYETRGFSNCAHFGDYNADNAGPCMRRNLAE